MNDIDREIRDALHAAADSAEPAAGGWDRLASAVARPHRRLLVRTVAGVAAVLVLVAGVAVAFDRRHEDQPQRLHTRPPRTSTSQVPRHVPPALMPTQIVATTMSGDLLLIDSRTGAVTKTIYRSGPGKDGVRLEALTPGISQRGIVYFRVRSTPDATRDPIFAYDTRTGHDLGLVTTGYAPAVSPDDRQLLVARPEGIALVDLPHKTERLIKSSRAVMPAQIRSMAWSATGRMFAVDMDAWVTKPDGTRVAPKSEIRIFDIAHASTLDDGRVLPLPAGKSALFPTFRADGKLEVGLVDNATLRENGRADGLAIVDPDGHAQTIVHGGSWNDLTSSADGRWLLASDINGRDGTTTLVAYGPDDERRVISTGQLQLEKVDW